MTFAGCDVSDWDHSPLKWQHAYNLFWLTLIPTGTEGIHKSAVWVWMIHVLMRMFVEDLSLEKKVKWYVMLIFSAGETHKMKNKNASVREKNKIHFNRPREGETSSLHVKRRWKTRNIATARRAVWR